MRSSSRRFEHTGERTHDQTLAVHRGRHVLLPARRRRVGLRRVPSAMNFLWFLGLLTIGAVLAPLIFSLFMMPLFGLLWLASRLPDSFTRTRAFGYPAGGALFIVQA